MTTEDILSLLQFNRRWTTHTLPLGDGSIATGDKQHLVSLYSGEVAPIRHSFLLGRITSAPVLSGRISFGPALLGTLSACPPQLQGRIDVGPALHGEIGSGPALKGRISVNRNNQ
jgi:hypothetical protein